MAEQFHERPNEHAFFSKDSSVSSSKTFQLNKRFQELQRHETHTRPRLSFSQEGCNILVTDRVCKRWKTKIKELHDHVQAQLVPIFSQKCICQEIQTLYLLVQLLLLKVSNNLILMYRTCSNKWRSRSLAAPLRIHAKSNILLHSYMIIIGVKI